MMGHIDCHNDTNQSLSPSMYSIRQSLWIGAALVVAACGREKSRASRNQLPKDTALANDLHRAAAASSAYGDAADIAMTPIPDSELDRPARPVRMREVATLPARAPTAAERDAPPPPQAQPAVVSAAPPSTSASTSACDSPAAPDQRRCLMAYLARSDVGLDRTYQALITALDRQAGVVEGDPPPATVTQLRQAQRAWLVYRDTECRRRNRRNEGPLWAPVRARCLGEFSRDREQELAEALARLGTR